MINEAMLETLDGRHDLATEIRLEMPFQVSVVTVGLIRAGSLRKRRSKPIDTRQRKCAKVLACGAFRLDDSEV